MNFLAHSKRLRQSARDRHGSGSNQASDAAISDWPGRHWIKRAEVEVIADCRIGKIAVANTVRTLEGSAIDEIKVPWVVARTGNWSEEWTCLPHADGTY